MPGFLVHNGAVITCPHAGKVTAVPTTPPRVQVTGMPVQLATDLLAVTGCTIPICAAVQWLNLSTRVLVNGQPMALQGQPTPPPAKGDAICAPPPVPPLVLVMQMRVQAT